MLRKILLVLSVTFIATESFAISVPRGPHDYDALIFELKPGLTFLSWTGRGATLDCNYSSLDDFFGTWNADTIMTLFPFPGDTVRTYRLELEDSVDIYVAADELRAIPEIRYVSLDLWYEPEQIPLPDDELFADYQLFNLVTRCNWDSAWNHFHKYSYDNSGQINELPLVGVMDWMASTPLHNELRNGTPSYDNIFVGDNGLPGGSEDLNGNGLMDANEYNGIDEDGNGACDDLHGKFFGDPTATEFGNRFVVPGGVTIEMGEIQCINQGFPWHPRTASGWYFCYSHGTHIAGVISAHSNDGNAFDRRLAGLAGSWANPEYWDGSILNPVNNYQGARIVNLGFAKYEVFPCNEGVETIVRQSDMASALNYAAATNVKIVQVSYGLAVCDVPCPEEEHFEVLRLGIERYWNNGNGGLVSWSGGNWRWNAQRYPNVWPGVLNTAELSPETNRVLGSFGAYPNIEVSAPTVRAVINPAGGYTFFPPGEQTGSSYTSPNTAALAALVMARFELEEQPIEVFERITGTADNIYCDNWDMLGGLLGAGRINAGRALDAGTFPHPTCQPFCIDLWNECAAIDTRRVVADSNWIRIVVQNFWLEGQVDSMHVRSLHEDFEFVSPDTLFLDDFLEVPDRTVSYGERLVTPAPFIGILSPEVPLGEMVSIEITVWSSDVFTVNGPNRRVDTLCVPVGLPECGPKHGWPQLQGIPCGPTIADFDASLDGDELLVVAEDYNGPGSGIKCSIYDEAMVEQHWTPQGWVGRNSLICPPAVADLWSEGPTGPLPPDGNADVVLIANDQFSIPRLVRWDPVSNMTLDHGLSFGGISAPAGVGPVIGDVADVSPQGVRAADIVVPVLTTTTGTGLSLLVFDYDLEPRIDLIEGEVIPISATVKSIGELALIDLTFDGHAEVIACIKEDDEYSLYVFSWDESESRFEVIASLMDISVPNVTLDPDIVVGLVGIEYDDIVRVTFGGVTENYAHVDLHYRASPMFFGTPVAESVGGLILQSQPVLCRPGALLGTFDAVSPMFLIRGSLTVSDGVAPYNWQFPSEDWWWPVFPTSPRFTQVAIDPSLDLTTGIRNVVATRREAGTICMCGADHDSLWLCQLDAQGLLVSESFLGVWDSLAVGPAIGDMGGDSRTEAAILLTRNCELDPIHPFWQTMIKGISLEPHHSYQFGWENHRHDPARRASTGVLWEIAVPSGEDVVWSDEIWISGNILVPTNSSLTITPGTRVHCLPGSKITVAGSLLAEGTATDSISFVGVGYVDSTWGGIHINTTVNATVSYVVLEGANIGVYLQGATGTTLTNSRISYCKNAIVFDKCCTQEVSVSDCEISQNTTGIAGVLSNGLISNNKIKDNKASGVFWQWDYAYCSDQNPPRFESNEVVNNGWEGMNDGFSLWGSTAELLCNTVSNNYMSQIAVYDNGSPQLGEHSSTGLGRNTFDASTSQEPVISIFSGDVVYKGGDNECAAEEPGLFSYTKSTKHHYLAHNYWTKDDPTRFDPISQFTVSPMHEMPGPDCTEPVVMTAPRRDGRVHINLDDSFSLYIQTRNAVNSSNLDQVTSSLFPLVMDNDTLIDPYADYFHDQLIRALTALSDSDELEDLANHYYANSTHDTVVTRQNVWRFLAAKCYAHLLDEESAIAQYQTVEYDSSNVIDSISAYVDMSLAGLLSSHQPANIDNISSTTIQSRRVGEHISLAQASLSAVRRSIDRYNDGVSATIPGTYQLYQNYPNPFNPTTEIRFDLPESIHAELKVFNILGQEVVTLVDDVRAAGAYRVLWDGKNAAGLTVASGVYVYQIKTPNFTNAKKMMLIR